MRITRRTLTGAVVALGGVTALSAAMLPLRPDLSPATTALVLIVPVVASVATGGFPAGVLAVVAGFLAYDFYFLKPYGTLTVARAENWVALVVYVVVMLVVARVGAMLGHERAEAHRREAGTRRLLELSETLISDRPSRGVPESVVVTVSRAFGLRSAALLLPVGERLELAASAGEPLSTRDLAAVSPAPGELGSLASSGERGRLVAVPLVATGRPVGLLVLSGAPLSDHDRRLLRTYANQAALALERTALREQAVRAELLAEVDEWRSALMGAVSHDLRTPLASVKAAVSDLRRDDVALSEGDRAELLELVESQSDRLARLVTNLLDMTRISAGALEVRPESVAVEVLVEEALAAVASSLPRDRVECALDSDSGNVSADRVLVPQVLANLLENAARYAPEGTPVRVRARRSGERVEFSVEDSGPGVAPEERDRIFLMFNKVSGGGRAGLGLAIAKAFLEAHHATISVTDASGGGARFVFELPALASARERGAASRAQQVPAR